jgi:phosphate transport system permease protein
LPPPPPGGGVLGSALADRLRRPLKGRIADRGYVGLLVLATLVGIGGIAYLIATTAARTGDVWDTFGVWGFITGTEWVPTPAHGPPQFGALPMLYGTLVTSAIALVLAVPIAVGVALATTVFLPKRLRGPVARVVDVLAAVPSVVFGLFGVAVIVPAAKPILEWIANHNGGLGFIAGPVTGQSYLIAGMVLGIMVLPIVAALSREVLLTVPADQQEAALALGATRWEMVRMAMLPWARTGIVGASALGLGRAVGETIAIAMLLGNSPNIFGSILGPGATSASKIALETGEATALQLDSLTALALVLFAMAFLINAAARLLVRRSTTGPGRLRQALRVPRPRLALPATVSARLGRRREAAADPGLGLAGSPRGMRRVRSAVGTGSVYAALSLAFLPLGVLLGYMLVDGIPAISGSFFTELPPLDPASFSGGIKNALFGTLIMMGLATAIAAPLGVLVALFVSEGQTSRSPLMRRAASAVGFLSDVLLGFPSIVVGLTVYLGLVVAMHKFTALAGAIALAVIMFPIVVRATDEVLRLVPSSLKEASMALGAPRWRTAAQVVLPTAAPGIVTGIMLAVGRAGGETAPLLFTSLGNGNFSTDVLAPIASLPQLIFTNVVYTQTPATLRHAWGAALVLVAIVLGLNLLARLAVRRLGPRRAR